MPATDTPTVREPFVGLAFPVIRVRYAGPTDCRGSRYAASCRGVRLQRSYDHALSASENAHAAAAACWQKVRATHKDVYDGDNQERVLIPGDLDRSSYSFTVVPLGFFEALS